MTGIASRTWFGYSVRMHFRAFSEVKRYQNRCQMHVLMFYVFVAIGMALYFTPAVITRRRMKREAARVLLLNLALGWTITGWIGALSWATKSLGTDLRCAENAARLRRGSLKPERD